MNLEDLSYLLGQEGSTLAKSILKYDNKSLNKLNESMSGELLEYMSRDFQGLTQCGSMMGHPRVINIKKSLLEIGFDAEIPDNRNIDREKRCDLLVEGVESECRGSIKHSIEEKYGIPRGGKYSLEHDKRIYFILKEKIDLDACEIVSLLFQILYIDSSKFEQTKSDKVNMTILKEVCPEDLIGEWEVFSEESS